MTKENWLFFTLATLCLLPPTIILTCYVFYIKTTPFTLNIKDISNNANDWSAFGSLLGGVFTFSGALATFLALLIALRQNKRLSSDALQKSKFDEKVASENREYMKDQKVKMNFEKYKIHLEVFHEILDRIERDCNGDYTFTSRNEIYKNLFPDNSFDFCSTTSDKNKKNPNGCLDILDATKRIEEKLKNKTYQKNFRIFIDDISSLKSMMMIVTRRQGKVGDIIADRRHIIFNIYDIYNDIDFMATTVNSLLSFCGFTRRCNIATCISTVRLVLSCNSFFSHQEKVKRKSHNTRYELIQSEHIDAMIKFYRLLKSSSSPVNYMIKPAADYIWKNMSEANISNIINENGYRDCLQSLNYILKTQKYQSIIMYPYEDINKSFSPYFHEIYSMERV